MSRNRNPYGALEQLEHRHLLTLVPFSDLTVISQPAELTVIAVSDVRLADLDGDQDPDLVLTRREQSGSEPTQVSWRLNDGNGNFGAERTQEFGELNLTPHLVDVDGDGRPDLVGRVSGEFVWFANNVEQNGEFSNVAETIAPSARRSINSIADLNGDGRIDFVLSDSSEPREILWVENTADSFVIHQLATSDEFGRIRNATVDVNGDGDLDIVHISDQLSVSENLSGTGESQFSAPSFVDWEWTAQPVTPFDVEGDGDKDLVFVSGREISWIENSEGQLLPPQVLQTLSSEDFGFPLARTLFQFDANGDNAVDLIWSQNLRDFAWWPDLAQPQTEFAVNESEFLHFDVADIDGDGDSDWVGVDEFGKEIVWFDGFENNLPSDPHNIATKDLHRAEQLKLVDLDGDQNQDVLVESNDSLKWYRSLGDGQFDSIRTLIDGPAFDRTIVDLNGDGLVDLAYTVIEDGSQRHYWRMNENGILGEEVEAARPDDAVGFVNYIDVDNDEDIDLAFMNSTASTVYLNDGTGNFADAIPLGIANAHELMGLDSDGDGDRDFIGYLGGRVSHFRNTGDGFEETLINSSNAVLAGLKLADADGDGDSDVFFLNRSTLRPLSEGGGFVQLVEVFENQGGEFVAATQFNVFGLSEREISVADFDSDGDAEVVVMTDDRMVYYENLFETTATITYQNPRNIPFANSLWNIGSELEVGDIDSDGHMDLVALVQDGSQLVWLRNLSAIDRREVTPIEIDSVFAAIQSASNDPENDWNEDGEVSEADVDYLLEEVIDTKRGDTNLDQRVDFEDFLVLQQNFGDDGGGWGGGDFNGDGKVDFSDFLSLAENFPTF